MLFLEITNIALLKNNIAQKVIYNMQYLYID